MPENLQTHPPASLRWDPVGVLLRGASTTPHRTAVIVGDRALTFSTFERDSRLAASALRRRGVDAGDRVALHLSNRLETILLYVACLRLGAIIVPLDTRSSPEELLDLVARTRPVLYVGEPEVYRRFADVPPALVPSAARVLVGPPGTHPGTTGWDDLMATGRADDARDEAPDPDRPALLLATSGTSGHRKLVVWSRRTIANLRFSAPGRGIGSGGVVAVFTPLTHASGSYFTLAALGCGAVPLLLPGFDSGVVLDAVQRHRATAVFGLPFMYAELVGEQRARPRDLTSLLAATVSGDVCPARIETAFGEVFGLPLRSFWASTEDVGSTVTTNRSGPLFRAVAQARVRVVGSDGEETPRGEVGELTLRSPTTTPGYWTDEDQVQPIDDHVFRSGDLVRRIDDEVFRYVGRAKDVIVRGGSNVSPTEVEGVLREHPDVLDVGVAGYPDATMGARVGAVVVLGDADPPLAVESITSWARERLADYKIPERIVCADSVPRNALTKIDRIDVTRCLVDVGPDPQTRACSAGRHVRDALTR